MVLKPQKQSGGWMKRSVTVLLLSAVLMTPGCGQNTAQQQADPGEEKLTLTFRHFWIREHDRPIQRIFEDVIRQYEQAHPHVQIDFEGLDQTIHREQKLKSEMVTGQPPDVFSLFGGAEIEPYVRAERLVDLTDFLQERKLAERFSDLSLWTFQGRVYGLPFEGNAEPLYYNKQIFESLGLAPPTTIDELIRVVQVLKRHDIIPFALGNEQRWPAAIYVHYLMDREAGMERFERIVKGEDTFNNEPYLRALETFSILVKMGAFPDDVNNVTGEQAIAMFTEGKAGMYLNGNWDITLFQNAPAPAEFAEKVGVLPFPVTQESGRHALAGGYTLGLGVSSALTGKRLEAALDFLAAVYDTKVQERILYEGYRIPAISVQLDEERSGPIFGQVIELTESTDEKFVPYDNMLPPEVKLTFLRVIAGLLEKKWTPEDGLSMLQRTSESYWSQRTTMPTE